MSRRYSYVVFDLDGTLVDSMQRYAAGIVGNQQSHKDLTVIDTLNTGTITGGSITGNGGGVYNQGTFAMYGGKISGNTANIGGGVYVLGDGFIMYGGEISNGYAEHNTETKSTTAFSFSGPGRGGNIYATGGNVKLYGGTIVNGTATADGNQEGHNVAVYNGSSCKEAMKTAVNCDYIVVCVGSDWLQEGEFLVNLGNVKKKPKGSGGDRADLRIPEEDVTLIKALSTLGKKLIVNVDELKFEENPEHLQKVVELINRECGL